MDGMKGVRRDFLDLELLRLDPTYQPSLRLRAAQKIADNLDWNMLGLVIVNRRAGERVYYVIDGNTRVAALRMAGEEMAPCEIHEGLTNEEEAELCVSLQVERRAIFASFDLYRARQVAQDPEVMALERAVADAGFYVTLSPPSAPNAVRGSTGLVKARTKYGHDAICNSLIAVSKAWPGDKESRNTRFLLGVFHFAGTYPAVMIQAAKRWERTSSLEIVQAAKAVRIVEGGEVWKCEARALVQVYNKRLTEVSRLDPTLVEKYVTGVH